MRRAIGCAITFLCLVALVIVVAGAGYVGRRIWLPFVGFALEVASDLQPADVIVVLGGGNGDRDVYASELYRRGLAKNVIATGSPVGTSAGARGLVARGIPRDAIYLANGSQNTHEDAVLSRRILLAHRWRTVLLVTDPYHERRALWTFQAELEGTGIQVRPAPVIGGWYNADDWWKTEPGFVAVNDEYLKIIYYVARGYIRPPVRF